MFVVEGQKFACKACVRGHRVSNCAHGDRMLGPIAPKGRPPSQCPSCKNSRKARGKRPKCDCGKKTLKCPHLQPPINGHTGTCCCMHGADCSCCGAPANVDATTVSVVDSESESEAQSDVQEQIQAQAQAQTLKPKLAKAKVTKTKVTKPKIESHRVDTKRRSTKRASNRSSPSPSQLSRQNSTSSIATNSDIGSVPQLTPDSISQLSTTADPSTVPQLRIDLDALPIAEVDPFENLDDLTHDGSSISSAPLSAASGWETYNWNMPQVQADDVFVLPPEPDIIAQLEEHRRAHAEPRPLTDPMTDPTSSYGHTAGVQEEQNPYISTFFQNALDQTNLNKQWDASAPGPMILDDEASYSQAFGEASNLNGAYANAFGPQL